MNLLNETREEFREFECSTILHLIVEQLSLDKITTEVAIMADDFSEICMD